MQTRIVDLEATLSQTRAEVARLKREKEEVTYIHFDFIVYSFSNFVMDSAFLVKAIPLIQDYSKIIL